MKIWRQVLGTALACLLAGCAQPKIDASSEDALKASLQEVRESLTGEDRSTFDSMVGEAALGAAFASALSSGATGMVAAFQPLDGMTGTEAIAKYKTVAAAREEKERAAAAEKRKQQEARRIVLEKQAEDAINEAKRLSAIALSDVQLVEKTIGFSRQAELTARLTNGLDVALATIKFDYTLASPERSVPWSEGEGWFFIKGGLEPSETRQLEGTSGMYGFALLRKTMSEHPEAVLSLRITDAHGADKKSVLKAQPLDESETAELERLRVELASAK